MHRIVIQLNSGANLYVRICLAHPIDLIEIDSGVITIVIGERDVAQALARAESTQGCKSSRVYGCTR